MSATDVAEVLVVTAPVGFLATESMEPLSMGLAERSPRGMDLRGTALERASLAMLLLAASVTAGSEPCCPGRQVRVCKAIEGRCPGR